MSSACSGGQQRTDMQDRFQLHVGDCLEVMRTMPDNSIDAIVTDPPYGLTNNGGGPSASGSNTPAGRSKAGAARGGFMGHKWDSDVPSVEIWAECLRVLKPGGHLLAFAGTRTQHRMAVRIEDAGFEIRDMIAWVYGSGFPKSLDVSKAIDKLDATEARTARRYRFTEWLVASCPLTPRQMDEVCGTNTMGRHWTDVPPSGKQPDVPTRENFEKLRPHIATEVPAWVDQMVDERTVESENFKRREVIGHKSGLDGGGFGDVGHGLTSTVIDITAPATDDARQWQGWGTALKPALEPITVARKPLIGTVAANVLEHGTGALNIDGCRVEPTGESRERVNEESQDRRYAENGGTDVAALPGVRGGDPSGRWPANLIHDGSEDVLEAFPLAKGQQGAVGPQHGAKTSVNAYGDFGPRDQFEPRGDTGSAARFFYCAKASKRDRDEGCQGLPLVDWTAGAPNNARSDQINTSSGKPREAQPSRNHHPTVKPTELMA